MTAPTEHEDAWTSAQARARFRELMDGALARGPQTITRRGRKAVIVVSADEGERTTGRRGTLADFFAASPLRGSGVRTEGTRVPPRDVPL